MKLSRRMFGTASIGAIASAPAIGKEIGRSLTPDMNVAKQAGRWATTSYSDAPSNPPARELHQLMDHRNARKLALAMPHVRAKLLEDITRDNFFVSRLDHDLVIKRSWSEMAKIHEQRQRNIKRQFEHMTTEDYSLGNIGSIVNDAINKLMYGE